jgi:hypothetical protein
MSGGSIGAGINEENNLGDPGLLFKNGEAVRLRSLLNDVVLFGAVRNKPPLALLFIKVEGLSCNTGPCSFIQLY